MSRKIPVTEYRRQRGYIYNFSLDEVKPLAPPPPSPPDPKKAIRFDVIKSEEDIVYNSNYKFNTEIDVLISSSKKSRTAKTNELNGINKTPRRQNPWILYRRDKSASSEFVGMKSSEVSLKIREMWQDEPQEVKKLFTALSGMAEKKHIEQYGEDYKYQPNHWRRIKKKQTRKPQKPQSKKVETFDLNKSKCFSTLDFSTISPSEPTTTLTSSPETSTFASSPETAISSPPPDNITFNSSHHIQRNEDIWHDPICNQFALNNEYSYDIRNIDESNKTNEINENMGTSSLYYYDTPEIHSIF